ncbi:MAG: peptidoglycan-binding protein [Clostridia bacterium]|nr:peptidoglycan-binding protein [Clostridia bacterium]
MIRRIAAAILAAVLVFLLIPGPAAKAAGLAPYTKTVRYGSSGSAVTELQEALALLGYYQLKIDGKAGEATIRAIKAFQRDHGLKSDGVAGPTTWASLSEAVAAASSEAAATSPASESPVPQGAPEETAAGTQASDIGVETIIPAADETAPGSETPVSVTQAVSVLPVGEAPAAIVYVPLTVTVRFGMRGDSVRALQEALIALGYRPGTPDGVCGNGTVAAIRAFQNDFNLTADGVAGKKTLAQINAALQAKGAPQEKTAADLSGGEGAETAVSPAPVTSEIPAEAKAEPIGGADLRVPVSAISVGDRGDDVYALQKTLFFLGYYTLSLDGSYGPGTVNAVKAFQRDHSLTTDGQAGPKTLQALDKAVKKALSAPANAEMTAWMDNLAQENNVTNGAAVITRDGETLLTWGWGGTDEDTCFRIASVTKWVTAIGLMTLYDQGLIDLDADISVYLPFEVRNPGYSGEKITARMLLNHTSSLRPDTTDYHPEWSRIGTNGYDPIFMENLQPGSMYSYADFDGALLGSLIEAITGESVQTYMDRTVFKPLGLTAAYTPKLLPSGASTADLLSTAGTVQISVKKDIERDFNLYADPVENCGYTVGRLFINASSLSVLAQMMIEGGTYRGVRILKENTVRLMESDMTPAQSPYGLGQVRLNQFPGGTWYGHQGRYGGLSSNVYYQKENGISMVLILNGYDYRLENNIVLPAVSILNNMDALMSMAGVTVD